jgi:putative DNA primase/helicase
MFDQNQWLLTCLNGTIDLKRGTIHDHDQNDLITKLAPVEFDLKAYSQDWIDFLDLITKGNAEMMEYLKRVVGYCLTGSAKEGSFFYVKGPTRTGKSTFLEAISGVLGLGDYAWKTPFDLIISGRRPGGPRDDIAALAGRRLVIASEAGHNQMIDTSVLKELTGEDTVNARHLYEGGLQIRPTYKLLFAANEFPYANVSDDAVWARLHLILFDNEKASDRKYLDLKQQVRNLQLTGSAILAWAVQGCLAWQTDDSLLTPDSVRIAAKKQRDDLSPIQILLSDEHCSFGSNLRDKYSRLWDRYKYVAKEENKKNSLIKSSFGAELLRRGFTKTESGGTVWFNGLRLNRLAPIDLEDEAF